MMQPVWRAAQAWSSSAKDFVTKAEWLTPCPKGLSAGERQDGKRNRREMRLRSWPVGGWGSQSGKCTSQGRKVCHAEVFLDFGCMEQLDPTVLAEREGGILRKKKKDEM